MHGLNQSRILKTVVMVCASIGSVVLVSTTSISCGRVLASRFLNAVDIFENLASISKGNTQTKQISQLYCYNNN